MSCAALAVVWFAAPAARGDTIVIPPGQEDLLAEMLGRGATLPGGCQFSSGEAEGPVARGKYACPGAEVTVELHHPSNAPAGAIRTDRFAVVAAGATPPAGLVDALAALVRARESKFEWKTVKPAASQGSSGTGAPAGSVAPLAIAVAVGIVALALLVALRRRRAKRAAG